MSEESYICPYTGLRSFTEEESLYFKGRDAQIDQISKLLERNKFLMVTGASGEGKSSLIFAGLIPNAKAGFFKARYNNWVVADFRPERRPVTNMAAALARVTSQQAGTVETELRRGFSSLVDLYTNSELFVNEQDDSWKKLEDESKKSRRRNAANLLVLVDQFEEFFTNPENFHHGAPSQDSQIVVNVLLETARIALNENLPIYVVCTMRSDYIGQCSAFRDLPEYIGFSQFFVPRLKRKELKQIIEEPAVLSGNRISQRLVERLVYDLAEGVDQLPILQHALSQIWLAADHGREEMDLIHYAKVGGMPSGELPKEDRLRFDAWFLLLPEYLRGSFAQTGLERVIELHANRLYEGASEYFNATAERSISPRDAKNIIALTFACLTKIDNSRAVRNRMTLQEITQILARPGLGESEVGGVLNFFREENNSFIRPFKTSDPETFVLTSEAVLDITHESLIRNWGRLNKWANQEFEFYTTFLDFKKQLGRWLDNGKSRDYLLPIGPLSFFEAWYAKCKPNVYWIKRYIENSENENSLEESRRLLKETQEFLLKSSRKALITRSFMKYGANRIAAGIAILLMVVMSGFYWYDADQKKNERVIAQVRKSGQLLLSSKEVDIDEKSSYLLTDERYEPGTLINYLKGERDPKIRLTLSLDIYKKLLQINKRMKLPVKAEIIRFVDGEITSYPDNDIDFLLANRCVFITSLAYDNYFNSLPETQNLITRNSAALFNIILTSYQSKNIHHSVTSSHLNLAVHLWLTFGQPDQKQVLSLINTISPWQSKGQEQFDLYYPKRSRESNYEFELDYGGGYHTLASLYAAVGDVGSIIACFEKINSSPSYFSGSYVFNNFPNVLGYLYSFGHEQAVGPVIRWITSKTGFSEDEVYSRLINQAGYMKFFSAANIIPDLLRAYRGNFYPNLSFLDQSILNEIWRDFEKSISKIKDPSERNFRIATALKIRAMYKHKYNFDRGLPQDMDLLNGWLDQSWKSFEAVSTDYRNEKTKIVYRFWSDGRRSKQMTRRQQYLYPDLIGSWSDQSYHSDLFFWYLVRKVNVSEWYNTQEDLKLFHYWIANGFEVFPNSDAQTLRNEFPVSDSTIRQVLTIVASHPQGNNFDRNLLYLVLANRAFEKGDSTSGIKYFQSIKQENIYASANTYEYLNKTFVYNQVKQLSTNLAKSGKIPEAMAVAERFEKPYQVVFSYVFDASAAYENNYDPRTFILLDSVMTKMKRLDLNTLNFYQEFRYQLLNTLGKIGGEEIERVAFKIMKDLDEGSKLGGTLMWIWGQAHQGNYYKAKVAIPPSFTETQELIARTVILSAASAEKEKKTGSSDWAEMEDYFIYRFNYIFYEPF